MNSSKYQAMHRAINRRGLQKSASISVEHKHIADAHDNTIKFHDMRDADLVRRLGFCSICGQMIRPVSRKQAIGVFMAKREGRKVYCMKHYAIRKKILERRESSDGSA